MQVTATLTMTVNDFFENDGETTFISNICAFLNIDPSSLKIVSVTETSRRRMLQEDLPGSGIRVLFAIVQTRQDVPVEEGQEATDD